MQPATSSWWSTGKNAPKSSDTEKNPDVRVPGYRISWYRSFLYEAGSMLRLFHFLFYRTLDTPPHEITTLAATEQWRVRFSQLRSPLSWAAKVAGKTGQLALTSWLPTTGSSHADMLVLGDSYADDVDMGYWCWPALLARSRGWSILSAARGGSKSGCAMEQYARARAFADELGLSVTRETICVIHLGGNDLLHSLWLGPLAFALLLLDIAFLLARRTTSLYIRSRPPRFTFFGLLSRRVATNTSATLRLLAAHGHRTVLLSGLPLCAAVPTARTVVRLLICGCWPCAGDCVSAIIGEAAALMQDELFAAARATAEEGCLSLILFDEASTLMELHTAVAGTSAVATFWRDAHHPSHWVHAELAARASAIMGDTSIAPSTDAIGAYACDNILHAVRDVTLRRRSPGSRTMDIGSGGGGEVGLSELL